MESDGLASLKEAKQGQATQSAHSVIPLRSVLLFLAATIATAVVIEFLAIGERTKWNATLHNTTAQKKVQLTYPTYAVYSLSSTEEHLVHVFDVLQRFGYRRVPFDGNDSWDLLWAHDYPYLLMPERMKSLQPHQMINHWPGCGFLTNKVDLCTAPLPFLPRAFRLPQQRDELMRYAQTNPQALFVEKHNEHRYIHIRAPNEVNLSSIDSFVQEFVTNPLLVDGYKFDIGVYVVICSVDPLRMYIYTGDVLFRYCTEKYYPFDENNVDKYVVGDDYLPTWKIPSLRKYYNHFGGSMRGAFDAYLRDQGQNPSSIWTQVEDIIRRTVLAKEQNIMSILRRYKTRNFFDLLRFDFIIDDQLRVHLMEANMSPNLSSAHFKPNSLLYEQILYSALQLVGIGSPVRRSSMKVSMDGAEDMITSDKNLSTDLNICAKFDCGNLCNREECSLCLPCLSGTEYETLQRAHREHLHRVDMRRIFPNPIINICDFDLTAEVRNLSARNSWMTRWFHEKCQYDRSWCY